MRIKLTAKTGGIAILMNSVACNKQFSLKSVVFNQHFLIKSVVYNQQFCIFAGKIKTLLWKRYL